MICFGYGVYCVYILLFFVDIAADWSDHALWWPDKNQWLLRSRSTLDQYDVQADAKLLFTPMHKNVRLQLPDLQILDLRMNFSSKVFSAMTSLCKELGMNSSGLTHVWQQHTRNHFVVSVTCSTIHSMCNPSLLDLIFWKASYCHYKVSSFCSHLSSLSLSLPHMLHLQSIDLQRGILEPNHI